jgi:hypothetical protein
MNATTLGHMLTSLGITANEFISNTNIHSINLQNDGNFYYDYFSHLIKFDTTNLMLLVKYYRPSLVSSILKDAERVSSAVYRLKADQFGLYGRRSLLAFDTFRNPRVGDLLYTIDENKEISDITTIQTISADIITTAADISISGKELCYASGAALEISGGSIQASRQGEFIESFLDNDSIILLRRPNTVFTTDEYISIENIEGFSLRRFNPITNFLVNR